MSGECVLYMYHCLRCGAREPEWVWKYDFIYFYFHLLLCSWIVECWRLNCAEYNVQCCVSCTADMTIGHSFDTKHSKLSTSDPMRNDSVDRMCRMWETKTEKNNIVRMCIPLTIEVKRVIVHIASLRSQFSNLFFSLFVFFIVLGRFISVLR